jgi:hypothetical protein
MDERLKLMLLKVLDKGGNVDSLEKAGYQYAEIASSYSKIINDELVIPNDDLHFILSDKGKIELEKLGSEINSSGKWKIESYIEYKIEKMNKYDIFIE